MKLVALFTLALTVLNAYAAPGDLVAFKEIPDDNTESISYNRKLFCPAEVGNAKEVESRSFTVTFKTLDLRGVEVESSGYLVVPNNPEPHGLVVYQHGTLFARKELPSANPAYGEAEGTRYCFASLGFVAMSADYLGFGDGTGTHPYLHAGSEAWVARDMMRAVRTVVMQMNVAMNGKLFIAGYSQGGHAAMALLRFLEQDPTHEFTVTAAAPMAGPYSLVEATPQLLKNPSSHSAAEAAYLILGLGQTYPIYKNLNEVFQAPYADKISMLFDGTHDWQNVLANISMAMSNLFQPEFLDHLQNDPQAPFIEALQVNRVDQWAPKTPINLYHGSADIEVPFVISQLAYKNLKANGATNVQLIDLGKDIDHQKGYPLAMGQAALWFETY